MLIDCPEMVQYRDSCEIGSFVRALRFNNHSLSSMKLYAMYLDDSNPDSILRRSNVLYHMYIGWHSLMGIPV